MSDSVWPHRQQTTRLPRSWDSPGKSTGVGCHFLLQCMKVKSESEVAQSCPTLRNPMDCSLPGSSAHGIFQARVLEWAAIAFSEAGSIAHRILWMTLVTWGSFTWSTPWGSILCDLHLGGKEVLLSCIGENQDLVPLDGSPMHRGESWHR